MSAVCAHEYFHRLPCGCDERARHNPQCPLTPIYAQLRGQIPLTIPGYHGPEPLNSNDPRRNDGKIETDRQADEFRRRLAHEYGLLQARGPQGREKRAQADGQPETDARRSPRLLDPLEVYRAAEGFDYFTDPDTP